MNKLIAVIAIAAAVILPARAQVNTNVPAAQTPLQEVLGFLSQGSNWVVGAYGTITTDHHAGGGFGIGYKLSDFVVPYIRLQYVDIPGEQVWLPNGTITLQLPINISTNVHLIPFTTAGVATPIAGLGQANGTAIGTFGAGVDLEFGKHFGVIAAYEMWGWDHHGDLIDFGLTWKF